jgi:diguanylate cyclase (GGDEF)-like protein
LPPKNRVNAGEVLIPLVNSSGTVDLQLYQLNISGLTVTTVMIALFFLVLRRSVRRAEMRWWLYGWLANVVALVVTSLFWYFQPPAQYFGVIFAFYSRGALEFCGERPTLITARVMVPAIAAVCVVCIFLLTTRDRLGVISQAVIAAGFGAAAVEIWRTRAVAAAWLAIAFAQRALLSAVEAVAYGVNVAGEATTVEPMFSVPANAILAAHFSLGIAAEWLLAMGMVIAVSARTQRDLQNANQQMETAQSDLRRLVDRDPLTGLANRRALPEVLRSVQPEGAVLIFFDLNDFKKINDEHGHQAGDACLRRFAEALTQCFRPSDAVVRYGGDEFLVVARGVTETAAYERADSVRSRVANPPHDAKSASWGPRGRGGVLPIRFSVGISKLAAGGNPEEAVREADEAMYRAKRKRAPARPRTEMAPQLPLN